MASLIFRQLFESVSSTYTYLIGSRPGGEALIIDPVIDKLDHYLRLLRELELRLDPINPPQTRMLAACCRCCCALRPCDPTPGMTHWPMGYLFMQLNASDYQSLFVRGRAVIILLAVALGWLVFRWAMELYWPASGVVALVLFAFSPDMLAHGHLVTLDMAGALGFTLTAYATWRMLSAKRWRARRGWA